MWRREGTFPLLRALMEPFPLNPFSIARNDKEAFNSVSERTMEVWHEPFPLSRR